MLCDDVDLGNGVELTVRIFVTASACGRALPSGIALADGRFVMGGRREMGGNQRCALPFVIVSEGQIGEFRRRVVAHGEAQFVVGRRSFARYAPFTDLHSDGGAGRIWFNERALFDGPVHAMGKFNVASTPWFGGAVSSAGVTGRGAQGASGIGDRSFDTEDLLTPDQINPQSPIVDVGGRQNRPVCAEAVPDRRASYSDQPTNAFDKRALATGPDGLLFGSELDSLELFAANAAGNPVGDGEIATYQIIRATPTYRRGETGRLERRSVPDGIVS